MKAPAVRAEYTALVRVAPPFLHPPFDTPDTLALGVDQSTNSSGERLTKKPKSPSSLLKARLDMSVIRIG